MRDQDQELDSHILIIYLLDFLFLFIDLFDYLFIRLFIYLFIYSFIDLFIHLYDYLSTQELRDQDPDMVIRLEEELGIKVGLSDWDK